MSLEPSGPVDHFPKGSSFLPLSLTFRRLFASVVVRLGPERAGGRWQKRKRPAGASCVSGASAPSNLLGEKGKGRKPNCFVFFCGQKGQLSAALSNGAGEDRPLGRLEPGPWQHERPASCAPGRGKN